MEIFIGLILAITFLSVIIMAIIQYAFKGVKCEMCGEIMDEYYDEEKQRFYYECRKCGHKEVYCAKGN